MIFPQTEDRGSHHEAAYHDHKEGVKWHSHYGHHTRDMIQWMHKQTKSLEIGGLIKSRLDHFHYFPVNGNVFTWLPCQHIGLYYGHHKAFPQLYIEDHGSQGLESNSVEAMDTCRQ